MRLVSRPRLLIQLTYISHTDWLMDRRDLRNCHRVPQDLRDPRIQGSSLCIRFGILNFSKTGRKYLRQEPILVLEPSTLSMNSPVELNLLLRACYHQGSLRAGNTKRLRMYATTAMHYSDCGIWVMSYSKIGVTSAYEFFMWTMTSSHDGETRAARSYLQAADKPFFSVSD